MAEKKDDIRGFSGQLWPQYQAEVQAFIQFLVDEDVRSYLEVGCRYGDTFHAVASALPVGSTVVAVDLPGAKSGQLNKGGHQNSGDFLRAAVVDLRTRGYDAHCYLGDSHAAATRALAAAHAPFDAVLIDGDHTAEGVLKDWKDYGPLGRLVAFHDIAGEGKWSTQIRPVYAAAAAKALAHREFIHDGLRRGIGVVQRA